MKAWRTMGWMERAGVVVWAVSFASCFFDIVDFASLPRAIDKLTIAMPLAGVAALLLFGGQQLRFRREDRERRRM